MDFISETSTQTLIKLRQGFQKEKDCVQYIFILGVPIDIGPTFLHTGCFIRYRINIFTQGVPIDIGPIYLYIGCSNRHGINIFIQGVPIDIEPTNLHTGCANRHRTNIFMYRLF